MHTQQYKTVYGIFMSKNMAPCEIRVTPTDRDFYQRETQPDSPVKPAGHVLLAHHDAEAVHQVNVHVVHLGLQNKNAPPTTRRKTGHSSHGSIVFYLMMVD